VKRIAQWLPASVALVAFALLLAPNPAHADSYTIFDLGDANGRGIEGIDKTGDVVIFGLECGAIFPCYTTYVDGHAADPGPSVPDLVYDDGTPCTSTPAGFNAGKTVCNHGYIGLGTLFNPNGKSGGTYTGSGNNLQFLHTGSADQVFLNSIGDFAWTDGRDEEIFEAIDNTTATPEPGSLLLVATGLLCFVAAVRRKAAVR
jgi:hypothetical protein